MEYKLLDRKPEQDIEVLREYAKARTELTALNKRVEYLEDLVDENDELRDYIWTTQEGESKPIQDLEDDHLRNIVSHLASKMGHNVEINKEYHRRFHTAVPDVNPLASFASFLEEEFQR